MSKTSEITSSSKAASQSSASFFNKNQSVGEAAPFFAQGGGIQTKLAIGKADDAMEQEADQVADRVQAKLAVGAPDDPYETEADQMADKVAGQLQSNPGVQRKGNGGPSSAPSSVEQSISASKGKGEPLPAKVQNAMGSAMGADFSDVRIHSNNTSAEMSSAINAQAFAHGKDIYFNRGKYNPASKEGQHLLAHELTHTVQQGGAPSKLKRATNHIIQKTGDTAGGAIDETEFNKYEHKEKKGSMKKNGDKFEIKMINFSLKGYVDQSFVDANKPFKKPKKDRDTDQKAAWRKDAKEAVIKSLEAALPDVSVKSEPLLVLELKKSTASKLVGSFKEISDEVIVPFWSKDGEPITHQIEHRVDFQILGNENGIADNIKNILLLDRSTNNMYGKDVKKNIRDHMQSIIDHYNTKFKSLPVASKALSDKNYDIVFDSFLYEKVAPQGLIVKEFLAPNHPFNPIDKKNIDIRKAEIKAGHFILKTSPDRAGYLLPYNVKGEKVGGFLVTTAGDETNHKLTLLKLESLTGKKRKNTILEKDLTAINFDPGTELEKKVQDVYILNNSRLAAKIKDLIGIKGLSPVEIKNADIDSGLNLQVHGIVNHNVQFLKDNNVEVGFDINGMDVSVYASITAENIKSFPKPFQVNYGALTLIAGAEGVAVEGDLGFEITKLGKGNIGAMADKTGFAISGNFEFDPQLFKSKISASYINNAFKFDGTATLEEGKLPGVKSLNVTVGYADGKVTGTGKAALNIPGVKEIAIRFEQLEDGGLLIAGDIEFGSKLKSDAKVQAVIQKGEQGWDVSIRGKINPNISVAGLEIKKVTAAFSKGVLDVSAKAHFAKGKIKGDFDLGVTNGTLDETGKQTATIGKELIFYASGELQLDIAKGVDAKLKVRITKEGDILIGGKVEVTENKSIVDGKQADRTTNKSLDVLNFSQKIPVASCGVVSLVLELNAGIGLFYDFKGVTLDKGTHVTLEEISLKDLNKAKINSDISISTGVKAGVDAHIGAKAGLQVLIAGVRGTGTINLRLTAFDATATAKVNAGFSAEEGLKFNTAELDFEVESKIGYKIELGVEVYLDLLVKEIILWDHKWKPADLQGERAFSWFGGTLKVPLKFGEGNSLSLDDVASGLKKQIGSHSQDQRTFMAGVDQGVNKNGPTAQEAEQEMQDKIKGDIREAYRGAHSAEVFAFNSSINEDYFSKRVGAWNRIGKLKSLKGDVKELLQTEIKGYEREEYDAFLIYLRGEKAFDADNLLFIIDDFMRFRPTLTAADKAAAIALVPADKKKTPAKRPPGGPVRKKEIPNEHGYAVPDDFADRMEEAKPNGMPLPLEIRAEMGKQFGADFSQVRVHYDNEAIMLTSEVHAQAFTHENHIFFNSGKYEPGSSEGKKLLAHELTHVLQQGHGEPVKRMAERDPTGTTYTGNYIFDPGKDGLSSSFFSKVKQLVSNGTLSDKEIRKLRKDAIRRNGSVLHGELLLMAAMRNPVNVALMQANRGGSLILAMRNILEADKAYVINFDRGAIPPELADPATRLASALLGLSDETLSEAAEAIHYGAEEQIRKMAGKQFNEQAERLIIHANSRASSVPLTEVLTAMVNAAADSTPGDQVMAGIVYVVARKSGHSTAPHLLSGKLKVDALVPSVYKRLKKQGNATYNYSTDDDISKANTVYLPTDQDIFELGSRALIIHELTHAADDMSRPTEQLVDSLALETRAYIAQGRHFMEEIIAAAPAPGYVTTASKYVNGGALYYWSMLLAAKRDLTKYKDVFLDICTGSPASKNLSAVKTDLASTEAVIIAAVHAALVAHRGADGKQMYQAGQTRLGGGSGFYFQ